MFASFNDNNSKIRILLLGGCKEHCTTNMYVCSTMECTGHCQEMFTICTQGNVNCRVAVCLPTAFLIIKTTLYPTSDNTYHLSNLNNNTQIYLWGGAGT